MAALARLCARHRWSVIAAWFVALVLIVVWSSRAGDDYRETFLFDGTESREAADLVAARFPESPGERAVVVLTDRESITSERYRRGIWPLFEEIERLDSVAAVHDPWADDSRASFSADGDTGLTQIVFTTEASDIPQADVERIIELTVEFSNSNRHIELGGAVVDTVLQPGPGENERWGLLAALLILVLAFGSVVAAGLPIVIAVAGITAGVSAVALTSHVLPISGYAPQLATLVGLGAGIDYALFVLTRFRAARENGSQTDDAISTALSTAGRAVVFAGLTVVVALLGLTLVGVELVTGMALGAAIGVTATVVAAVTLLPAALAILGDRVDKLKVTGRRPPGTYWRRWADRVQARPLPYALGGLVALLLLATPTLWMRLGTVDAGASPETQSTRRAYDIVAAEFGPGTNGPLILVTDLLPRATTEDAENLAEGLRHIEGIASVRAPVFDQAGVTAVIEVTPDGSPDSAATEGLVTRLRSQILPSHLESTGATTRVGGITAAFIDQSEVLGGRLPLVIGAVVIASLLLLLALFRGVLVAAKAAILNLLSVGAAYGVIVAVFQWGWGLGLIGLDRTGPIIAFVPVFLFAVLFGLSMDYEVFLLSRVKEDYDRHGDNSRAVADGLANTGRVITAAAAIMIAIFGSFVLGSDPVLKLFGLGLAVAILVDVTLVRMILVPAVMELAGDLNWWAPQRIRRPRDGAGREIVIDLRDRDDEPGVLRSGPHEVVDDPYLVALATGHSTLIHRDRVGVPYLLEDGDWPAEVGVRPVSLAGLFQAIAFVEDDNAAVLRQACPETPVELRPVVDLALLFSERHRDLAIDRVDELILLGTPPPDTGHVRTDPSSQSLAGRARRTEHLWRAAEQLLEADTIEVVSATAIRWWLRRSSSQWRELGRRGLLQTEPGLLPRGVHRLYHLIAETEHAGAVALYRFAELDDPELARLADRRRSLSKLFRDRLAELDDRAPLPPLGGWTDAVPAPVVVGPDMDGELLDHPLDGALVEWYRNEVTDVMAETRARSIPIDMASLDPAQLPVD